MENPKNREEIIINENHLGLYLDLLRKLRQKDYIGTYMAQIIHF